MWALQVALVLSLLAPSVGHFFEDGYSHHYTYRADNSLFDQHNVTTILKFHVQAVGGGRGAGQRLHSLQVDSLLQYVKEAVLLNNPRQWDLSKTFLFVTESSGQIRVVHCHPEDHEELLVIKKAMVSIFAVHVQIEEDKGEWSYTAHEHDHLGSLWHQYTAQRTDTGLKLHRKHSSSDHAFRTHEKTLHYDHGGTLHRALATDHVLLKNRSPPGKPSVLPGEKPHSVESSGDFPQIKASATVQVTLEGKRIIQRKKAQVFHNLTAQTLETKPKLPHSRSLAEVREDISGVLQCLQQFPQRDSENRSICINNLRDVLRALRKEDYKQFVDSHLGRRCHGNDTSCRDQRLVVIDVVARLGDVTSQQLLVTHVLTKEPAVSEELRRVFIHCVALEKPTAALVQALEQLCFGREGQHEGRRTLTSTMTRACLAVGGVARRCAASGQQHTADSLVDRLEKWLELHGAGDHHVNKRDTLGAGREGEEGEDEGEDGEEHMGKAVLLHALGNAALPRSRRHLVLHATPNRGRRLWRRAALDAMRHFRCAETADSLLKALQGDHSATVRQTALGVFLKHPRRHEATRDLENDMLREDYTYRAVARVKRGVVDGILASFHVAFPALAWKKELGSAALGASFGLQFQNRFEALFRVLKGEVKVGLHDKVWAEIHLGLIDMQWDIFRAEVCYKGRLLYNANVMKDFTKSGDKVKASAFDLVGQQVVQPLEKVLNQLSTLYQHPGDSQPRSGFRPLAQAVEALPESTQQGLHSAVLVSAAVDSLGGQQPLVSRLQQLAARAQSLMEDVHSEATDLFSNVKEAAMVALPFAEKEIRMTLNTVLEKLGKVADHPRQVFSYIERSRMNFYLAMERILESNTVIKEATAFFSGSRSSFMNAGHELSVIAESSRLLAQKMRKTARARRSNHTDTWTDTEENQGAEAGREVEKVLGLVDAMAAQLDAVRGSARPLQEGLDQMFQYTELLKSGYQSFKLALDFARSRISAVFGLKFHPQFPAQRRDCEAACGCGFYPTGQGRYGHPGMDLALDTATEIISPVAGLATPAGPNSVSIQPATVDFGQFEILLSNIELSLNLSHNGTFVDSGQVLGVPAGKNSCEVSHFHVAMKHVGEDSNPSQCYHVDPFPYLHRQQPVAEWQPECRDFLFRHIGQVVDFRTASSGLSPFLHVLKRFAVGLGKNLVLKAISSLPDNQILGPIKSIASVIIQNIDVDASNLKQISKRRKRPMKAFFKEISTKKFNLKGLLNMTRHKLGTELRQSLTNITSLLNRVTTMAQKPPLKTLRSLATGSLRRILSSRNVMCSKRVTVDLDTDPAPVGGCRQAGLSGLVAKFHSQTLTFVAGRAGLMNALKASACMVCPQLGPVLASLSRAACVPHSDCLGMDCDVQLEKDPSKVKVDIKVKVDPERKQVTINTEGMSNEVLSGNVTRTVTVPMRVFQVFKLRLSVRTSWEGREVQLTLGVEACAVGRCLPSVDVARNITFKATSRRKRSTRGPKCRTMLTSLDRQPLEQLGKTFADTNTPSRSTNKHISGIQHQVANSLLARGSRSRLRMKAEFVKPRDYLSSGKFPLEGEEGDLYLPFFRFTFAYSLGPVLLNMEFDAGGAIGVDIEVKVRAMDSLLKATLKPWVSGKFRASLSLSIVVASAGVDLTGWVMKTGFPLSMTSNFTQFPIISRKSLDLELIPIELELQGWVEILFFLRLQKTIWHYKAAAISTRLWERVLEVEDPDPPHFLSQGSGCGGRGRRQAAWSDSAGCRVYQLRGGHPKHPVFSLEFLVNDDQSAVDLAYAVGDYLGGTNVQGWTNLSSALQSPAGFPCGVPLYFMVRARNTQGLESRARCGLPTWDCTLPEGRVDADSRCSSHPSRLRARVVLFEDSPLQRDGLLQAVGYSPGSHGHEVLPWNTLTLSPSSLPQPATSGSLRQFGAPRPGRLSSNPRQVSKAASAELCASECIRLPACLSFVYSKHLPQCELHDVTEGANSERLPNSYYQTYERLGKSYTATLLYENLKLRHGIRYYVNADVTNVLGFRTTLSSGGTMMDATPPEPGPLGSVRADNLTAGGCRVSLLQRCQHHLPGSLNHRRVIDGSDSRAVFNGNRRGQEMAFTVENYHAAANWPPFRDAECGVHGYTWAVGRSVCGTDVVSFTDPHSSIPNPQDWTHLGLATSLQLPDGAYYVTVQAVSDILHGGDLVTTVCHSTPFVVDTTPPLFHAVNEFLFDESFRTLVVYYNVSDPISGVARMEMGLGRTKYDVMLRRYLPLESRGGPGNTFLVNQEFDTQHGVPAWIRLKVVNNVGLSATGSSLSPVLVDSTPPVAGTVLDGLVLGQDLCCQNSTTQICAQWLHFHDPESSISSFSWGVGSSPGKDDVVSFQRLTAHSMQRCTAAPLRHNATYFSTVVADNKALNTKSANASSDGLLIDVTPPVPGRVSDGSDVNRDVNFTSETATVAASWTGFHDNESGVASYRVAVLVNGREQRAFPGLTSRQAVFADHSFSLQHTDTLVVQLQASNRAGGSVTVASDGLLVDHSPPEMLDMGTRNRTRYQLRDDLLDFLWQFADPESGIQQYRCVLFQLLHGQKTKFWPQLSDFHAVELTPSSAGIRQELKLEDVQLQNGASYTLQVTALNHAGMAATRQSPPVIVDTTPPQILTVRLTRPGEEEELNDNGVVVHVHREPLWVTWTPHDAESGIKTSHVCLGPAGTSACLNSSSSPVQYQTVDAASSSSSSSLSFSSLQLQVSSEEREVRYQAYVLTFNQAGVASAVAASRPFLLLRDNVAGQVLDGRGQHDLDFSSDSASIAVSFSGFSSQACGVEGYQWAVGTSPFATDVLPYSGEGLVVEEDGSGQGTAQAHVPQKEGQKYFSTVRAKTGANCHQPYITSCSDGFVLDTTPPRLSFRHAGREVSWAKVVYLSQTNTSRLPVLWKAEDASGVEEMTWVQDVFSSSPSRSPVPADSSLSLKGFPSSGQTLMSALELSDRAGNERALHLPPLTWDTSPPSFRGLRCCRAVSSASSLLRCGWDSLQDPHSSLARVLVGLGSGPSQANLLNLTALPLTSTSWSYDAQPLLRGSGLPYLHVLLRAVNAAGLRAEEAVKVVHDVTPPKVGGVIVVTSPAPGFHDVQQRCQTAQDYMEVLLNGSADEESGVRSVEFALGSAAGRSDVTPFRERRAVGGMYILEDLALSAGVTMHVTARVTNTVGLYVIVTSEAVVISPQPRLEVSDGPEMGEDMDGQSDLTVIQGRWRYTDPCPVVEAEWSVKELGGPTVLPFTPIDPTGDLFYNDGLHLQNFKTYVNYIRIRDALNRSRVAYSDGVSVVIRLPATAEVRDGAGQLDLDFQHSTRSLTANWDVFGQPRSTLPSDHILSYWAALGTDPSRPSGRSDVHGFEAVGLATNVTFYGLTLTARTQTYFVTVRARSAAGGLVESSSDGVRAGFSSSLTPGRVRVSAYQSSVTSLRFSWAGFHSDMLVTRYFAGVSSSLPGPLWDNHTGGCGGDSTHNLSSVFDVKALHALTDTSSGSSGSTSSSMAVLENLSLRHGASYYVTVLAEDSTGLCAAATSQAVLVDVTPPVQGKVKAEGHVTDSVIYLHDADTLRLQLHDLADPESGVDKVSVQLLSGASCRSPDSGSLLRSVEVRNQTTVVMRGLGLKEGVAYFLRVALTNGAGLTTHSSSLPLLLDTAGPEAGLVKLGRDWTGQDQAFQQHTDRVSAVLALQSASSAKDCVTQTDVMSGAARQRWRRVEGRFRAQCVQLDSEGMHVLLRHDAHLAGVERGAAQYGPVGWREGDYRVRVTPPLLLTSHLLTGIALTSPSLHPPFTPHSALCRPADNTACQAARNQTSGTLGSSTEYGLGLTFYSSNNSSNSSNTSSNNSNSQADHLQLLFWARDFQQVKQTPIPLTFNPAGVTADYTLRLRKRQESGNPLWEVSVLVSRSSNDNNNNNNNDNDNKVLAAVSGLSFPGDFVLTVYSWNQDDYFPPVLDMFDPFRRDTVVRGLWLPVDKPPACSYGSAFRDATSDLREVWAGVSDSPNRTANVAPFALLRSFCRPCLRQCPGLCSSCSPDLRLPEAFLLLPLTLQGLRLQPGDTALANNASGNASTEPTPGQDSASWGNSTELRQSTAEHRRYQLPTYYLDVRVVDHSGLATQVKSAGFVIDTSPPRVHSLACFNPEFSADVAVSELGNNHTVGVTWEVSEDVSSVAGLQVSLGTRPGVGDVVSARTVQAGQSRYVFANLTRPLAEGGRYFVTVQAENSAGARGRACSNFTVRTAAPVLSPGSVRTANVTSLRLGQGTVEVAESLDSLVLDLDLQPGLADVVESFQLTIGTASGREDVFPKTIVGKRGSKQVAIVRGFVQREEAPAPISVGDYTRRNVSTSDLPDPSASLFRMEPGRCLQLTLYGLTRAHVAAAVKKVVCSKRGRDVLVAGDSRGHLLQLSGSAFLLDPQTSDPRAFSVSSRMKSGGLMAGVLTPDDVTKQYGSSASAEFSPFIVPPVPDDRQASRWLKKRLRAMPGPHVFLTPVAGPELEGDLVVNYTVPPSVQVPEGAQVLLLFWNPVEKEWQAPEELCSLTAQTYHPPARLLSAKVCARLFSEAPQPSARRRKRSTTSDNSPPPVTSLGARMLTVAVIRSSVPNQAPSVQNTTLTLLEDRGIYNFTLTYTDPEGDDLTFRVPQQPKHGRAEVTPEGKVSYRPFGNYTGRDTIYITGKEVLSARQLALGLVPNVVTFHISVHITGVNDPPDIFYRPASSSSRKEVSQEVAVGPAAGNGLNMTVYIETNSSSSSSSSTYALVLGLVVFSDVDANDTVHYASARKEAVGANFTEKDVASHDPRLSTINITSSTGISGKEISLTLTPTYTGQVQYHARVKDSSGSYSMQLTLNVFVLWNPCVQGQCRPRSSQRSCQEPNRAFSFRAYLCLCHPGYEGEWCQTETDECSTATCSPITDCVDLIGGYRCDVNPEKMAAIIVCCVGAVALAAVVFYKLKKRPSKVEPMKGSRPTSVLVKPSPDSIRAAERPGQELELQPTLQFMSNPFFIYTPAPNPATARRSTVLTGLAGQAAGGVTTDTGAASPPSSTGISPGKAKPRTLGKFPARGKVAVRRVTVHPLGHSALVSHGKRAHGAQVKNVKQTTPNKKSGPGSQDDVTSRTASSSSTQSHYVIAGATEDQSVPDVQ